MAGRPTFPTGPATEIPRLSRNLTLPISRDYRGALQQWRDANPGAEGNLRDHAPLEQLVVLTNLESLNSVLIRQGQPQSERLATLNDIAITQMRTLLSASSIKLLK